MGIQNTDRFAAALVVTGIATAATSRTAVLTGEAEVDGAGNPNQGDLDGSGFATITLRPHRGEVCWDISVVHIALPALAAHIHAAPAAPTGPLS